MAFDLDPIERQHDVTQRRRSSGTGPAGGPSGNQPMQYRAQRDDEPGPIFTGRKVIDEHGLPLGSITDVVYAPGENDPEYLIVDPGLLRRAHYVPAAGACQTPRGEIVVPWDRDWFRLAPKASGRPVLSRADRRTLEVHYSRRP